MPDGLTTEGLIVRRYFARVIDSIAIMILLTTVFAVEGALIPEVRGVLSLPFHLLPFLAVWIGYGTVLESSPWQATLGKRILGLKVYDPNAGRIDPLRAAERNLVKDGPFLALAFVPGGQLLSLLWLGAHVFVLHRSPVYQAIHDRAAHTWVAAPEQTIQLRIT